MRSPRIQAPRHNGRRPHTIEEQLRSPVQGQPWTRNEVKAVLYALEAKAVVVGWPTERMEDDAGPYPRNRFDIGEGEGVSCCFIDCC